jgi:hypothetical protein
LKTKLERLHFLKVQYGKIAVCNAICTCLQD